VTPQTRDLSPGGKIVSPGRKKRVMKTMKVVAIATAGISVMVAVAAYGQMDTTASSNEPKAEAVVEGIGYT
jgi:hypothetical protein